MHRLFRDHALMGLPARLTEQGAQPIASRIEALKSGQALRLELATLLPCSFDAQPVNCRPLVDIHAGILPDLWNAGNHVGNIIEELVRKAEIETGDVNGPRFVLTRTA